MLSAVFWDYENCRPHSNASGHAIVDGIVRIVRGAYPDSSIIDFKAYVDLSFEFSNTRALTLQSELQSSGLSLVHCPHNGKKDVADKMMLVDMMCFAIDHPSPGVIAIISGDRDFAYAAATLKLRGYRVVVIGPKMTTHSTFRSQADLWFDWQKDVLRPAQEASAASQSIVSSPPIKHKKASSESSASPELAIPCVHGPQNGEGGDCEGISDDDADPLFDSPVAIASRSWDLLPLSKEDMHGSRSHCDESLDPLPLLSLDETGITELPHEVTPKLQSTTAVACHDASELEGDVDVPSSTGAGDTHVATPHEQTGQTNECGALSQTSLQGTDSPLTPCSSTSCTDSDALCIAEEKSAGLIALRPDGSIPYDTVQSPPLSGVEDVSVHPLDQHTIPGKDLLGSVDAAGLASATSVHSEEEAMTVIGSGVPPKDADRQRFSTLIRVVRQHHETTKATRILSATLATAMLKLEANVYERAGVSRLKDYIEAARAAKVVISPGLNSQGTALVEIHPSLYCVQVPVIGYSSARTCTLSGSSSFATSTAVPVAIVSTVQSTSSESSSASKVPGPAAQSSADSCSLPVDQAARIRFATMIIAFNVDFGLDRKRVLSWEVATALRKRGQLVFECAGTLGLKEYIEAARGSNVVISPGLDSEGAGWVEINPMLYWNSVKGAKSLSTISPSSTTSGDVIPSPKPSPAQEVDPQFRPLLDLLRCSKAPAKMYMSVIGMVFQKMQGVVYRQASVSKLSEYLAKAVTAGIVQTGTDGPGREWVKLKLAYKC